MQEMIVVASSKRMLARMHACMFRRQLICSAAALGPPRGDWRPEIETADGTGGASHRRIHYADLKSEFKPFN